MDFTATIIANRQIVRDGFLLTVSGVPNAVFDALVPGQFAHIRIPDSRDLTLRRPFAIFGARKDAGELDFVYAVIGEGTKRLSRAKSGGQLRILAPLGNGFILPEGAKTGAVVGGGSGCAALLVAASGYPDMEWSAYLGFPNKESVFCLELFEAAFPRAEFFTDDGSFGRKGNPTQPLEALAKSGKLPDVIFACGPDPMLHALRRILQESGNRKPDTGAQAKLACQVSLEARMGCGVGACLVCACATIGPDGKRSMQRACADGPVFSLWEVELDG